jgi:RNA polymerase sigma-70 factor (ECF subfamily)
VADPFSEHRDHLMGVAYRMLGSRVEAEDAVQEAWLRYAGADTGEVVDLRAWLTTVVGRICLDQLRSARVRREAYVGPWLPEPFIERLPAPASVAPDPAEHAARADRVSFALLVVLETLSPEQRVAFVLHDVFAVPFEEVAGMLHTSVENARQLASRARRTVAAGERRHTTDLGRQRRTHAAFMEAAAGGNIEALVKVLAPDVVSYSDGGGVERAARRPVSGAVRVARFMIGLFQKARRLGVSIEPVLVNGDLGILVTSSDEGRPRMAVHLLSVDEEGLVTGVYHQINPEKLKPALADLA